MDLNGLDGSWFKFYIQQMGKMFKGNDWKCNLRLTALLA